MKGLKLPDGRDRLCGTAMARMEELRCSPNANEEPT